MIHTDTPSPSRTNPHPTHLETPMSHPTPALPKLLITLTALLALVLTIALPLVEAATTHPTTPASTPTHTTPAPHTTPRPSTTPDSPHISKADRAAAHHDGCRQTSPSDTLLARPSCRSGMPITRDHSTLQAPDTSHPGAHPVTPNEVPPSWSGHWRQAAHSPYHHSRA